MIICKQCPLYKDAFGGQCNPRYWLNPETGDVYTYKEEIIIIKDVDVGFKLRQDQLMLIVQQKNGNMKRINGENISNVMSSNEKIARKISGLESGAIFNAPTVDDMVKQEAKAKFNQQVDDFVEKLDKHEELLTKYAQSLADDLSGVECKPLYEGILIKPFEENPFQRIKREGRLIVDLGGQKPVYKSHEDGEFHEEESFIRQGVVIEVGPTSKYVKVGDIVMWRRPSETPIPFYKQGWVQVAEHSILATFNTGLTERFKNIK